MAVLPAAGAAPRAPAEPAEPDLEALLCAVRHGCRPSFARLYAVTSGRLFGIVLRITRDRDDALEVLQEVYVKVWTRCPQFDPAKGPALYWMSAMAHHGAIDSLRRRNAQPRGAYTSVDEQERDPYAGIASPQATPAETLHTQRAAGAVQRCLRSLSPHQREVLTLAFHDGLSHREIALRLGRPLGTVKAWISRSFAQMRPLLADHADCGER